MIQLFHGIKLLISNLMIISAMKVFASPSEHMEFHFSISGPADAPEFYAKGHQSVLDTKEGKTVDFTELNKLIDEMENSANTLLEKLPNDILNECKLMLEQFKRIAIADRVAAQSLKNNKLDSELKNLRQEIKDNESKAMVSELSLFFSLMKLFNYMNK